MVVVVDLVDIIVVDGAVEHGVQVVQEPHHLQRTAHGRNGGETHYVAEVHRHLGGWESFFCYRMFIIKKKFCLYTFFFLYIYFLCLHSIVYFWWVGWVGCFWVEVVGVSVG